LSDTLDSTFIFKIIVNYRIISLCRIIYRWSGFIFKYR